mgnify:CR=1 FL=1
MSKSVVILGKGPSVLRCTKDFIDSFDEVAGCGRPVFNGYEQYISSRLDYHFTNKTATPYSDSEKDWLGIKETILCHAESDIKTNFKYKELDPSAGILAFDFFLKKPEYTKIALVGFDLFQQGKKMYYFDNEEFDPAVSWLWHDGTYDQEGNLTKKSLHDIDDTYEYLNDMFDSNKDKQFYIFSSYPFTKRDNLEVL